MYLAIEVHLQFPRGSPSTELSDFRQSARSGKEHSKTCAIKGNDVITNAISANQHLASTFLMQIFKFKRRGCKLSFRRLNKNRRCPRSHDDISSAKFHCSHKKGTRKQSLSRTILEQSPCHIAIKDFRSILFFFLQQHFISYLHTQEKLQNLLKTRKKSSKITVYTIAFKKNKRTNNKTNRQT